jgi:hypothetical protein
MPRLQAVLMGISSPSLLPGNRKVRQHVLNAHDDVKLRLECVETLRIKMNAALFRHVVKRGFD